MAQDLILELGQYNAAFNTYPVAIKSKMPMGGVLVACNADIPIPREEARVFKQHFDNNILRPEMSGNFQSIEFFRIAKAYVIDDATNKQYDLFTSKFVDLGNGIVYDSVTKLLWTKNADYYGKRIQDEKAKELVGVLVIGGLSGWKVPSLDALKRMRAVYYNYEPHPFENVKKRYVTLNKDSFYLFYRDRTMGDSAWTGSVWPVRGE